MPDGFYFALRGIRVNGPENRERDFARKGARTSGAPGDERRDGGRPLTRRVSDCLRAESPEVAGLCVLMREFLSALKVFHTRRETPLKLASSLLTRPVPIRRLTLPRSTSRIIS